jgi:hypothetical protein
MVIVPASATAGVQAEVGYISYGIVADATDDSTPALEIATQYVEVRFTYNGQVFIADPAAAVDDFYIAIAGNPITASQRPLTVSADGNDLVLTIGPNAVTPPPTAIQGGIITITATATDLAADIVVSPNNTPTAIDLTTLIPGGTALAAGSFAGEGNNPVSVDIATRPQVRGIVNIGIYKAGPGTTLVPIDLTVNDQLADLSSGFANGLNAYPAHFPNFQTATPATTAADIAYTLTNGESPGGMAAVAIAEGYTITASGSTLTVTGPAGEEALYIYIVDDELIKALARAGYSTTYTTLAANGGILPGTPVY